MPELPVTPAPGEVGESSPARPKFDEAQKLRINEIVADATKRATAESRAEAARLKAELDSRPAAPASTDDAELRTRLALAERECDALKQANTEASVMAHIRSAIGDEFVDSDLAANLLRQSVKMVDGKPLLTSSDGSPALNASFEPLTLQEAAANLAAQKPFLVRSTLKGGAGSLPSSQPAFQTESVAIHKLWGPNGDCVARNNLAMTRPNEYRQLRQAAKNAGLVA
jgi:hypothetical protein